MTVNEKSLANIKPFEPGNDFGKGRPKGSKNLSTLFRDALELEFTRQNKSTGMQEKKSNIEWVILENINKALRGDMTAAKEIYERYGGKVAQTNILQGDDEGGAIQHEHQFKNLTKDQIDALVRIREEG